MTTYITCQKCGELLAEYKTMPPAAYGERTYTWYDLLYDKLKGKCLKCSRQLPEPHVYKYKVNFQIIENGNGAPKK